MSYHFFTDQQAEADLLALLDRSGQMGRLATGQDDQNWLDVYDDDARLVIPAAAALTINALRANVVDPMFADVWNGVMPLLPPPTHPERAAFANAFILLGQFSSAPASPPVHMIDVISTPRSTIEAGLLPIARTVQDYLDPIARADYGDRSGEHRTAIELMLANDFQDIPLKERWFPMEVLELVSHVPGQPGHVPALAIVLLDAVRNDDAYGDVEFRWERQRDDILAMPPSIRDPLVAAFRHAHEVDNSHYTI